MKCGLHLARQRCLEVDAALQGVERQIALLDTQGVAVKVHRAAGSKLQQRQWLGAQLGKVQLALRVLEDQPAGL